MKRQPSEWEKITTNETIDKGLISKYISTSCNSIKKQTSQSRAEDLNRHFPKKTYRWLMNTRIDAQQNSFQRNANQNYNEISPHIGQNGHHQNIYKQ